MKIIFIFEYRHYYAGDDQRFGIQYFIQQGYDVEVWSTVYWTFGHDISTPQNLHTGKLIYINNEKELENGLERLKTYKCCFIIYPYYLVTKSSYIIRKEIKRKGFDFYNLSESLDLIDVKRVPTKLGFALIGLKKQMYMLWVLLRQVFLSNPEWKEKKSIVYRLWGPMLFRSNGNFLVGKSQLNYLPNPWEVFRKKNVFVPHMDYGLYLEVLKENVHSIQEYAVFVDEYEIGHSDFEKSGVESPIKNRNQYYKELNNFFSRIERDLKLKVVIAAHPKAEYQGDEFEGREIRCLETAKLIKNAKITLYEYGTSISYVLLFKKDFIHFCMGHHFQGHMVDIFIRDAERQLKTKLLDISRIESDIKWQDYIKHYEEEYNTFIEQFIVPKIGMEKDMFMIMNDVIRSNYCLNGM